MSGEKESAIAATIIKDMVMVGIPIPLQPPQIVNPVQKNPPAVPPTMIDNIAGTFI